MTQSETPLMEKITDKVRAVAPGKTYHSLEFFPPKTDIGFQNLHARLERMANALQPLFVTVTWGAGGSTAHKSLELAEICQQELELTTCLHMTCTNMSREILDDALEKAKAVGIRNILALRGDPPRNEEYDVPTKNGDKEFEYAVDLVRYIREKYGDYFCIGVAAYPEGHAEGTAPEKQSAKFDLPYLIEKVKAGADFIMTQLFYDADKYISFEKMLREDPSGVFNDIIIIPGLMPIQSYQILKRTSKLSHASIPDEIDERLIAAKADDAKVKSLGVEILSEIITKIRSQPTGTTTSQARGFHFYTLNLEKAVSYILEQSHLLELPPPSYSAIEDGSDTSHHTQRRDRRRSSVITSPNDHIIIDTPIETPGIPRDLTTSAFSAGLYQITDASAQHPDVTLQIMEGEGSMGREATWDDFPNGRFGDARSPAFGEIDGYGPSLHVSRAQAIKLWGHPVTPSDVSELFVKHITGAIPMMPWSEEDICEESSLIQDQLVKINKRGWWTLASQPAVNSARSEDDLFGWGPKGGFIFQKAFVEFFCPPEDWEKLQKRLERIEGLEVSFYAAQGERGEFRTNMPETQEAVNAVTWGVFKGQEILSPTIIDEANFKAWREEAFQIWREWSTVYPARGATNKLLKDIYKTYWLVNIVHHDYMEPEALWKLLEEPL